MILSGSLLQLFNSSLKVSGQRFVVGICFLFSVLYFQRSFATEM